MEGIEPPTRGFGDRRSTIELHRHIGGQCENRTHYFRAWDLQSRSLPSGPLTNSAFSEVARELNPAYWLQPASECCNTLREGPSPPH